MIFLYSYQYPVMSNEEAIASAIHYLQDLEDEKSNSLEKTDWNSTPSENIRASLHQKSGFWNKLTNKMKWEVTLTYKKQYPVVVIDAYTGRLIGIYGPSS